MNIKLKIFVGVMVFLGLLSGAFLLFGKKKVATTTGSTQNQATSSQQATQQTAGGLGSAVATNGQANANVAGKKELVQKQAAIPQAPVSAAQAVLERMKGDWQICGQGKMTKGKELFWSLKISEGIPVGGTYAKATIDGQAGFPVRITIKAGLAIADVEKIKARFEVGKNIILRGTCLGSTSDGSVAFEAF